ncbi:MAG: hypothetical protein LBK73_14345 [Treponema sp.]|jgi:hypothetical protein|nr:hypothetical protein [Treponema sp.]
MKAYYYGVLPFALLLCSCPTIVLEGGVPGPAGGYVFYDKGEYSDGWRYLECAPKDGYANFGGYEDWYVPSVQELKWMSDNLYKKGMGDFDHDDDYPKDYYLSSEKDSDGRSYYVRLANGGVNSNLSYFYDHSYDYAEYTRTVRKF